MESALTAYISIICVSGVFNVFLCMYAFSKRASISGATAFIIYTIALSIYCFSYAIGLTSSTLDEVLLWNTVQYIGMPAASPLGLLIVMQYLGIHWRKRTIALLFVIPFISFLLVATNAYHGLFYKSIMEHKALLLPYVQIEIGIWYVVHGIFTFGCMSYAFLRILLRWRETSKAYRKQLIVLMIGQFVPISAAFLYLIGMTPAGIDPVPIVMWISSGLYIWAILSSNMFSIQPIAKEMLFNNMSEGVIVLDRQQRLVDFNSASKLIFPKLSIGMIGSPIQETWQHLDKSDFPLSLENEHETIDFSLELEDQHYYYQARASFLRHKDGAIIGYLLLIIDVTLTIQLQQRLEKQAYFDGLTQIYNRAYFFSIASEKLQTATINNSPFSVILFDIDHFKLINDTYGHDVGDHLLSHIVEHTKIMLPQHSIFARYGGEEFVIALPHHSLEQAEAVANKIRHGIEHQPLQQDDLLIMSTASFGVAHVTASETLKELLIQADQALYEVKRNGRNGVKTFQK